MVLALQGVASALGVFLLAAALGKLDGWLRWKRTLARLIPLGRRTGTALRIAIPTAEFSTAVLLFVMPEQGLLWSAALLVLFALAAAALSSQHKGEECGCFGTLTRSQIGWKLVVRNFCLAAISAGAAYQARHAAVPAFAGLQVVLAVMAGLIVLAVVEWWRLRAIQTIQTIQDSGTR